ncbi:survival factor 1 family protein [Rhodotorula paludigena]|uniref:survival factor 1 family protein n=1 Tax=Rhodotorula paludigena TaxID=86838 RepID=UPI00316FD297
MRRCGRRRRRRAARSSRARPTRVQSRQGLSWFGSSAPTGPNIHPVQTTFSDPNNLYGPLTKEDLSWNCGGGINTETQVWYATMPDGALVMAQIIHSSIGLLWPNIQVTFRYCNPKTQKNVWKSVTVTNFKVAPSDKLDKRSCKSDQITVTVDPSAPNKYTIEAKYDDDVQISLVYEQLCQGFKLGPGPRGGLTYFGQLSQKPTPAGDAPAYAAGGDGYCVHRFWPRCAVSGIMRVGGDVVDLAGSRGVFIHAIQGLRPNLLAAKWNFANFQTVGKEGQDAVSLIMMEFTTTPQYGSKVVNVGCVVVGDELVAVTAGGSGVVGGSTATHLDPVKDAETGYLAPSAIKYNWEGTRLGPDGKPADEKNAKVQAVLVEDLVTDKATYQTKGLVEKVDVLGQIPYLIRKVVNYAAGTKPYIYTWLNPVTASITLGSEGETKTIDVDGYIFNEASFISE